MPALALLLATLALMLAAGSAAAARPHLTIAVKPAAAEEGTTVKVSGRVKGHLDAPTARYLVSLQSTAKGKFATVASTRLDGHHFALRTVVPAGRPAVHLRLRLSRGDSELGQTKPWKLAIRARPAAPPTPSTPAPAPTPGAKTVVLSPASVLAAPAPGSAGTLRLTGVSGLNPGDVIAVGIGPNTPTGFLGRALAVSQQGAELLVETVPAELPEALPEGEFDQELEPGELDSATAALRGPRTAGTAGAVVQHVDAALECSTGAEVHVSGRVTVHPKIEIGGSWGFFSGLHAKFIGSIRASTELEASAEAAASCAVGPQTLFERSLDAIEFWVGPIPVVVVPVLSASISAEGDVEASVATELHASLTAKAGLKYDHGNIHPVAEFEKSWGWTPPEPHGSARLEAKVSPTIDLLIYGIGGPSATFNAGLALAATTEPTPSWALTAPVSLTATLSIPALDISTGNWTVFQDSFPIAEG